MYYLTKNGQVIESSDNLNDLQLVKEGGSEIFDSWPPLGKVYENGAWRDKSISEKTTDNEISLADRRDQLKSEIISYLLGKLEEGVEFNETNFQAREEDLVRMSLALKKIELGGTWGGFWRDSENQWQAITAEGLGQLALAAGNYWEESFRKSRILIDGLASKNKTQLANYDIEAAWNALP